MILMIIVNSKYRRLLIIDICLCSCVCIMIRVFVCVYIYMCSCNLMRNKVIFILFKF